MAKPPLVVARHRHLKWRGLGPPGPGPYGRGGVSIRGVTPAVVVGVVARTDGSARPPFPHQCGPGAAPVSRIHGSPHRLIACLTPIHRFPGCPFFIVWRSAEISLLVSSGPLVVKM